MCRPPPLLKYCCWLADTFNLLNPVWGPFYFFPTCLDLGQILPWEWERSGAFLVFFAAEEERDPYRQKILFGLHEWKEKGDGKWTEATGGTGANLKCSVFITCSDSLSWQAGGPADCTVCCSELAVAPLVTHSVECTAAAATLHPAAALLPLLGGHQRLGLRLAT